MNPRKTLTIAVVCGALMLAGGWARAEQAAPPAATNDDLVQDVTQGALRVKGKNGGMVECPLKHTDVQAQISGFIARVKVTQTFENPYDEKIEAVYVFPLPHKAAVDDMTMVVGNRRILGLIKRRAEAREIYEQALAQGATAALLEQERPNIFTQSVGNIPPKGQVQIEISYVDVLEYDMGTYTFHFPMVVGPRYIPGGATSAIPPAPPELKGKVGALDPSKAGAGPDNPKGTGWAPDTTRVPDASRITPPVLKPGVRNGHDISLSVSLDAGVPIQGLKCLNHQAEIKPSGATHATAILSLFDSIPNKDFVLQYNVVGKQPEMAVLTHTEGQTGYFMLMIQPREDEQLKRSPPRELVFLVDVSGSMSGQPTEKVKETMAKLLRLCKPQDTVQVITFASDSQKLFPAPIPCTEENIRKAVNFTEGIHGSGGTEMLKGIRLAIDDPLDKDRMRIVILLTDGFIGNEAEIIAAVGRGCGDRIRFWCVGIGSAPNRFLLDGVARQGGGMAKVVGLKDDAGETAEDIMMRIHRAQLADIRIDWGGVQVMETYPAKIPELWAGRPVILFGLCQNGRAATITVSGTVEGQPVSWPLAVAFPSREPGNEVLAKVWARYKIEDLMQQTYYEGSPEVEELVTAIALEYRLMSPYTSFVAVDEKDLQNLKEPARPPRRMLVPVPLPEGVSFEGVFGAGDELEETKSGEMLAFDAVGASAGWNAPSRKQLQAGHGGSLGLGRASSVARRLAPAAPACVAKPAAPRPASAARTKSAYPSKEMLARSDAGAEYAFDSDRTDYFWRGAVAQAGETAQRAQTMLKTAQELRAKGAVSLARPQFALVYLLDTAAMHAQSSGGANAATALAAIQEIDKTLVAAWTKDVRNLHATLDLVLCDQSIPAALEAVGKAGGVKIDLLPGSVADAAAALGRSDVRITYLDLRHATVAQALDWILLPARMNWWVAGGTVTAGTVRRAGGDSAWVYDVSLLALPSQAELKSLQGDQDKSAKLAATVADDVHSAVAKTLGLKADALTWYGPGQILIYGHAGQHAAAAKLFADLAAAAPALPGDLAALQKQPSARAQAGKDATAARLAATEQDRVAAALDAWTWPLAAAAAQGKLDDEALTELRIAWQSPQMGGVLAGAQGVAGMRSLWALAESARALPREAELAAVAKAAQETARKAADAAAAAWAQTPHDQNLFLKTLYDALARPADADYRAKVLPLLARFSPQTEPLVTSLLGTPNAVSAAKLTECVAAGVQGDDMVVLTALACRRAGGDVWNGFRAAAKETLGNQPLSGGAVVLVNALSRASFPMLAKD